MDSYERGYLGMECSVTGFVDDRAEGKPLLIVLVNDVERSID